MILLLFIFAGCVIYLMQQWEQLTGKSNKKRTITEKLTLLVAASYLNGIVFLIAFLILFGVLATYLSGGDPVSPHVLVW